jgi:hypothetical protein
MLPATPVRRWVVALGFATVTIALVVAALLSADRAYRQHQADGRGREAVEASSAIAPQLLHYDFNQIDADLHQVDAVSTGDFQQQNRVAAPIIKEAVVGQKVVTSAIVTGAAALDVADSVKILVFLTQTTTGLQVPAPRVDAGSAVVTMRQVEGRWVVAGFERIPGQI